MTGSEVRERLLDKKYVLADIAEKLNISAQTFNSRLNAKNFKQEYIDEIENLLGISLKNDIHNKKLIPLYDDVRSVGGNNDITTYVDGISSPSDYIDTGDWFRDATAAIRYYGESMIEYPTGCILAIKEVHDRNLIIPGRDYVIETSEYRVTKKIQIGEDYVRAYSTNTEKYEDGSLIHQPFNIPHNLINKIFLVLGYVVKKNGGTMIFSNTART